MDVTFMNSVYANILLAVAYGIYKVCDRCMQSKCKYTRDSGFAFDSESEPCPVDDMEKLSELLKQRSFMYKNASK